MHRNLGDSTETLIDKIVKPLEDLYQGPDPGKLLVYKGRPLNGIWATAPYLHNGSVPNLKQLLLPASQRVDHFYVGSREFDPVAVGFKSDEKFDGAYEFRVKNDAGEPIPGNSNAGHEYGSDLSPAEQQQLLEFLKSL